MRLAAGVRFLFTLLVTVLVALPVLADDITISGSPTFASLDGSSLDHDGAANGVFTVDDGNLTIQGSVTCLDDGAGPASACAMQFAVSGNFTMLPGSSLYAENRKAGGNGGNIGINAGGNVSLQSNAVVSSGTEGNDNGGNITIAAGGAASFAAGSAISAASNGGQAGAITVTGGGAVSVSGLIASGPTRTVQSTRYTGDVVGGGSSNSKGGNITIRSTSSTEPAVVINGTATIVSQGENSGAGRVLVEGCRIEVRGLVASVSKGGTGNAVSLRSGTTLSVDGRDLGAAGPNPGRLGMVRADSTQGNAATYKADLFAPEAIEVLGPASGSLYSVNSNPDGPNATGGTIRVISTDATATASGNAFRAGATNSNDNGGSINVSARNDVVLNGASIAAIGGNNGSGGSINVRSHSGAVSWLSGTGDARPTGSSIAAAKRGTITLTYCTTVATAGSSFPTNGSPVGPYPTTVNSCTPASPSLPSGELALPDCNDPPIAVNDAYTVAEGGTLNVAAPGVLGNDVDPDGDPITAILVSGPANASSFTLNANGSFSYTHNGGETTSDSFTYKASDGTAQSNTATVTITVTPVNDPPVANNDNYTVAEGGTLNVAAPGVMANDTDPDGPTAIAILVSGPANASSFVLNPNGSFIYTHNGSETTSDSFTYQVSDGSLTSNVATVSITVTAVNDAPVATPDSYATTEGGTLNVAAPGVLGNDTDADSPSLTAILVSGPANASSFTLNPNGSFSYTHNGGESTSDSFTYKANDGSADSNTVIVTIAISSVNDAPVAAPDTYATTEGGTLNVAAPGVLVNDTDADIPAQTLTAVLVSGPANASSFTLNANGSFTYVHNGSETTSDSFTYKANDGTADSNVVTVSITITPVNDAPVAVNDSYSVAEGGTLTVAAPGVLGNDTDADVPSQTLTAILISGPANASSFTLNPDGSFTYVHNGGESTSDSFTYKANDGTADSNVATVSITVTAVNDAPVAVADNYSVAEGGTLSVAAPGVLGNDTDVDSPTLTAVLVSGPANAASFTLNANGSFTYVHNGSETTSDSFTYKANDGSLDSNTVTVSITITPVNDAPVAVNDGYSVAEGGTLSVPAPGVLGNDTDAEGSTLTATLISGPANAASFTLNADGSFTYVHNGGESTTDSFTYKASDGALASNTATVTITITPVNDAPVANNDAYNTSVGGTLNVPAPGVLGNDTDVDSPTLTAVLVSGPTQGNLTLNPDGSFTYVHTGSTSGTDSFTYQANDGTANSNVATVTITIVNQAPVVVNDTYAAVGNTERRVGTGPNVTPSAQSAGSVLDNDTDPDTPHAALVVSSFTATSAAGGSVTMTPTGNFNYLPPVGFVGTDTFQYTVTDGTSSVTGTVTLNVSNRVWYVNNASIGGDGRSTTPFNALASAEAASSAGDFIYVHFGTGTALNQNSGIVLKANQKLIGQGVALVVSPFTLNPAGPTPTIGNSGGDGVTLASGNTVAGLNITPTGSGIVGTSVTGGTITKVTTTFGNNGIALNSASGTFNLTDVSLSPAGASGLDINGGSPTVNATNLTATTTAPGATAILGNSTGTLSIGGTSTASAANGTAVDISNMTLLVNLVSANASASTVGLNLSNTTGTFMINGVGTTAGSGGTIQNMSVRGAQFTSATGITLKNMNFVNAGSVNGTAANVCGNIAAGTNTGCNAGIHFQNVSGVTLSNVSVSGGAQIGINGNGVSSIAMTGVSVTGVGNEVFENGVQLYNLGGTTTVVGSTFSTNFYSQFAVANNGVGGTLNVSNSTFNGRGVTTPTNLHGVNLITNGPGALTASLQSSSFTNNFSTGVRGDALNASSMSVTVNSGTITSNGVGINLTTANTGSTTFTLTNNVVTGSLNAAISVVKIAGSSSGTINGNTIGTAGVVGSGCSVSGCLAIDLTSNTTALLSATVANNTVRNFDGRAISASAGPGSAALNIAIRGNIISEPGPSALNAIFTQSGSGAAADTTSVCADINTNTISGATYGSGMIRVRNRSAATLFRMPGFLGPFNSTAAIAAFLTAQNGGATATATLSGNTITGGGSCGTP